MRGTTQKLKLLYLKEIFEEETDNEHAISMPKIVEELEKHGVPAERKSIYDDIRLLQEEYGLPIYHADGGRTYSLEAHDFEFSELKLIIDAVSSCKTLSEKMSSQLIEKLKKLCSKHERATLHRQIIVTDRAKTQNKAYAIMHMACEQAVTNGLLARNPAVKIVLPKKSQKEIHFFTVDEQQRFINGLPDDTSGRALYFILGTGIRLAELSGLRWSDIHDEYFTIRQTIRRNRNFDDDDPRRTSLQVSTPKTTAGRRSIPLTPKLKEILDIQREHQKELRKKAGPLWHPTDLVFTTEVGTPYEGRNMTRTLHRILREEGIGQLGVHALRHTFATRALEAGMDLRTLSEILGHANSSLTLQLYAHSTVETKMKAMGDGLIHRHSNTNATSLLLYLAVSVPVTSYAHGFQAEG